ncbi:uncharacterized protein LOC114576163 [Exaiptasia diaphana]|uniref:Chromo domain-containing protein n=1 Tax=Exaiptasia diaphana TaxID=2652724 RepID=A0A913YSG1_EXADI|nr:uncharacterized protein LOC114576163 [Exaiptasia diaphana]
MYVNDQQSDWDLHLQTVLFAYRVSPSEVTGESPFYLLYGREPRLPMDVSLLPPTNISASVAEHRERIVKSIERVHEIARENIQRAQQKMKTYYDGHTGNPQFRVGDKVWVYTPHVKKGLTKKLAHNWHGPYRLVKQLSPVHFVLRTPDNSRMSTSVHVNRMKRYVDPEARPIGIPPLDVLHEPYLKEHEMPDDSFEHVQDQDQEKETPESSDNAPHEKDEEAEDTDEDKIVDNETIFRAEKIVDKRKRKGVTQYLIKWKDCPASENTWEPEENIFDYSLIAEYEERKKDEQGNDTAVAVICCFAEMYFHSIVSKGAPRLRNIMATMI